jgi:photosynthetic reaction center cytochrome c subunit
MARLEEKIMKFGFRYVTLSGLGTVLCLLAIAPAMAQSTPPAKPLMAEDVFKNVQVLKGIPVGEFMDTMGFFAASLGLNCTGCHVAESLQDWSKFADDVPRKRMARQMILMVNSINKTHFGGRRALTCYSCHRGGQVPEIVPSLLDQYTVAPDDVDKIEIVPDVQGPSADQILDKYLQALGGAERLAGLTSFAAHGTIEGYDTYHMKVPFEVYAKAPGQRVVIAHTQNGDSTTTFDGHLGWVASVNNPVRLLPLLPGAELDAAKLDADLCFPGNIKQALTNWRTGFPVTTIDDKDINVIQGTGAGGSHFKLYFEDKSGLLARQVRYENTPVGAVPTQIDYSDYREVAGIKMPFHWVVTWTDGQSTIQLDNVQPNIPIDPQKFAKPAPAVVKPLPK